MIAYALCGSFCTMDRSLEQLRLLAKEGYSILPIFSFNAASIDTRFGRAEEIRKEVEEICGRQAVTTVEGAEPIGPRLVPDLFVIAPCTGNTLAKLANGITDTPVTMAAKSHLRNGRPLVIALATNDALSANFPNLASLLCRKNVYFVPMAQDDPEKKPFSMIADFHRLHETMLAAWANCQLQPLFLPAGSVKL